MTTTTAIVTATATATAPIWSGAPSRSHSAEANIGRIASLYERLSREPLAGLRGGG